MVRLAALSFAAAFTLLAGPASAAPKAKAEAQCERAVGTPVCCKTFIAHHCTATPCCEVGNAGFYTSKECQTCADQRAKSAMHAKKETAKKDGSSTCSQALADGKVLGTKSCEVGNKGFYSTSSCCASGTAKSAGSAEASCCGARAKK